MEKNGSIVGLLVVTLVLGVVDSVAATDSSCSCEDPWKSFDKNTQFALPANSLSVVDGASTTTSWNSAPAWRGVDSETFAFHWGDKKLYFFRFQAVHEGTGAAIRYSYYSIYDVVNPSPRPFDEGYSLCAYNENAGGFFISYLLDPIGSGASSCTASEAVGSETTFDFKAWSPGSTVCTQLTLTVEVFTGNDAICDEIKQCPADNDGKIMLYGDTPPACSGVTYKLLNP